MILLSAVFSLEPLWRGIHFFVIFVVFVVVVFVVVLFCILLLFLINTSQNLCTTEL